MWGDSSALRHTSMEQHLYISKALLISLGFMSKSDPDLPKDGMIVHVSIRFEKIADLILHRNKKNV